ncbi:MAG TPA: SRPBCC family protein [Streptosporangiaceae bacterium]|nr:SRPBCC family protein [Streptosporangiaceae bacterium]
MAHYHATVGSRRSADETFGYMAAFSNAAEWDPGVLAGDQLDPGPLRVGSRFRLVVSFLGRHLPLTYSITDYAPHHEVVLVATSRLLRSTDRIVVTPADAGASVSYDANIQLRGPLRLLDPLMSRGFRSVADRATAGLARTLSAAPAPQRTPGP